MSSLAEAGFFNPGTGRIFQQDVVYRAPPHWQDSPPLYREVEKAARTWTVPAGGCTGSWLSSSLPALIGRLWVLGGGAAHPCWEWGWGLTMLGWSRAARMVLLCKVLQWVNLQRAYKSEIDLPDMLKWFILYITNGVLFKMCKRQCMLMIQLGP